MSLKEQFPKLYKTYVLSILKNDLVKSAITSLTVFIITNIVVWLTNPSLFVWTCIFSVLLFGLNFIILYSTHLPNEKSFARRLDELGLSQRVITLYEYKNAETLMAKIQRQNAIKCIKALSPLKLKGVIKLSTIILLFLLIILASGAVTVNALSVTGVIGDGQEIIGNIIPEVINQYEITYDVEGEGYIEGDFFQLVEAGGDATEILAVPADDWFFIEWSDGVKDPYRHDLNVQSDINVFAIFAEVDLDGDPELELEPELDMEKPFGDLDKPVPDNEPYDPQAEVTGGKYEDINQVIDGETYYGDNVWRNAYEEVIDEIRDGSQQGDNELNELINKYFEVIQK